jgi:hypothetical protein
VARARGGTKAYFTRRPASGNWLVKLVGIAAARLIGEAIAPGACGVELEVPMGPAKAQARRALYEAAIRRGFELGHSRSGVALSLGICVRTVDRHVRRMREAGQLLRPPAATNTVGDEA